MLGSRVAQQLQHARGLRGCLVPAEFATPEDQLEQFVVGEVEQLVQPRYRVIVEIGLVTLEESRQQEVVLQKPPSCTPAQPAPSRESALPYRL